MNIKQSFPITIPFKDDDFSILDRGGSSEELLKEKGIYYITGAIDENGLLDIHQDILLKHLDPKWNQDIQLIINSVGGSCSEGWALLDLLDWIKMDVRTTGLGFCASLGAVLVACGTKGKRSATRNTSFMIHGAFAGHMEGNKQQIAAQVRDFEQEYERDIRFWLEHSKFTRKQEIENNFLNGIDKYISPEEALKFEIIDEVIGINPIKLKKNKSKK